MAQHDTLNRFQRRSLIASVGRLAGLDGGPAPTEAMASPMLRLPARRHHGLLRFPDGSSCVTVDDRGRIKVTWSPEDPGVDGRRAAPIGERLGWADGPLDAVLVEGWAILRQPDELAGRPSQRLSRHPHYSSTRGRIQLRPAHRDCLGVDAGMPLLVAPVFSLQLLIAVSPDVALAPSAPPEHVITACLPPDLACSHIGLAS